MRVTLSQELQEKVDRAAQTADVTKQTKLLEIIDSYFSESDAPPLPSFTDVQSVVAPLEQAIKSLEEERERYNQLYLDFEWLKGEYALATTKLLPAAEKAMTPWWTRLVKWLKS